MSTALLSKESVHQKRVDDILRTTYVHPGHPLIIAWVIMETYPTYREAFARNQSGYPVVHHDRRIPGSMIAIGNALKVLEKGLMTVDPASLIVYADRLWREYVGDTCADATVKALDLTDTFLHKAKEWLHDD